MGAKTVRLGDIVHRVMAIDWAAVEADFQHMLKEAEEIGKDALHEYGDLKALLATLLSTKAYAEKLQHRKNMEVHSDLFQHIDKETLEKLSIPQHIVQKILPLIK